ncbi:MAG TPA: MarR family transcriptional regulator [Acidimicrobiales bacterium]|jgi:DNA-binding MarR family transcriptional regulator|nr:MarR family transcriptional regulator [Acidimicrobiales bacterium]
MSEAEGIVSEVEDTAASANGDHVDRVLAQWARVRPELDLTPMAVIARLGRAAAYLDAGINAGLSGFGLSRASWDVLASLRRSGPPYRKSPTELYLALMRTSGAMTHRLARLERSGLIRRVPDPGDGRGLLVELTVKGVQLVDRAAPAHLNNERALLASLSADDQAELARLLRTLLRSFERSHPGPPAEQRKRRTAHP